MLREYEGCHIFVGASLEGMVWHPNPWIGCLSRLNKAGVQVGNLDHRIDILPIKVNERSFVIE